MWAKQPIGTGERLVYGENNGQPNGTNLVMFLVVPAHDTKALVAGLRARLLPGRYLLKYYCDLEGEIDRNYKMPTDFAPVVSSILV